MNRKDIHRELKALERDLFYMQQDFGRGGQRQAASVMQKFRFRVENLALEVQGPPKPPPVETDLFKETTKA